MRAPGLDLVKWLAMLTMVADHLRFVWPQADGLFVVGRVAFPLFCLAIAVNVARNEAGPLCTRSNLRYLGLMLVFTVLSEPVYRWLDSGSLTFSIMPTLVLGLLVAWGVHYQQGLARLLGLAALISGWLASDRLMYGLPGVLLPAGWLLARRHGGAGWLVPCLLAMAGNLTNGWLREHLLAPFTWLVLSAALFAIPLGVALLRCTRAEIPAVGRWGYAFYPGHLVLIKLMGGG